MYSPVSILQILLDALFQRIKIAPRSSCDDKPVMEQFVLIKMDNFLVLSGEQHDGYLFTCESEVRVGNPRL